MSDAGEAGGGVASGSGSDERPNVLFVLSDQQRWDTVGAYDSPLDITPNLDRAAEQGTLLEHTFSPQPVCGPTRACIQTGTYATTCGGYDNGVTAPEPGDPEYDQLLARAFAEAGYDTGYVGKWHLADAMTDPVPESMRAGYEFWRGADALEFTSQPYEGFVYDEDGELVEFDGYRVDALTDMMIDFIEQERDAPFFGFLSQLEPHHQNEMDRYVAPEGYEYRHRNPWVPGDLEGVSGDWHEELPDYYGICERLDECYGRLFDALERVGELENTIVVYTSDHGSHFRTRNTEYKRSCHESSIRVPGIVRGPGFEDGGTVEELVSLIDLPVTLLDAAGVAVPDRMEGQSLLPLVSGERDAADWRDAAFVQQMSHEEVGRTLRTGRWKYSVEGPDGDTDENPQPDEYVERFLYDLYSDPHERQNLLGHDHYRDVADDLRERLLARIAAVEGERPAIRRVDHRT
jgi:arylsulfatase A-like enzyme